MGLTWFVCSNDIVHGPLETEDVKGQLASGELPALSFIWWKGQHEWMPIANWQLHLDQIMATKQIDPKSVIWYLDIGTGSPIGPMTQKELLEHLGRLENLNRIHLWTAGMTKWQKIYELHDIMDHLGVSRREHARAPLMGSVAVTRSTDEPSSFVLKAASIGIGGLGLTGQHDLQKDDQLALLIKSKEFPSGLHLRGSVAYVSANGYVGIRFGKLHAETHSMIFDYVKRFTVDTTAAKKAA